MDMSGELVQGRIDGLGKYLHSLIDRDPLDKVGNDGARFFLSHPIGQAFVNPRIPSNEFNKVVNTLVRP